MGRLHEDQVSVDDVPAVRGHQMDPDRLVAILAFITFFTYFGHYLNKPVVPEMLNDFFGDHVFLATAVAMGSQNLLAFFLLPGIGAASEAFGRKPVLLVSLLASQCPEYILAFTSDMYVYLILEGTVAATHMAPWAIIYSYVADTQIPEKRTTAASYIIASFAFAVTTASVAGGLIAEAITMTT